MKEIEIERCGRGEEGGGGQERNGGIERERERCGRGRERGLAKKGIKVGGE